jgi:hypothetical protein
MHDADPFDDPSRPVMRPSPTLSRVVVRGGTGVLSPFELLNTLREPAGDGKSDPSPARQKQSEAMFLRFEINHRNPRV